MENWISKALEISRNVFGAVRTSPSDPEGSYFKVVDEAFQSYADHREEIQKLRDFYNGDQIEGTGLNSGNKYIPDWPDEDSDDKDTRAERMEDLAWNRIRDGVLTHADALYASGVGVSVHRRIEWEEWAELSDENKKWLEDYFVHRFWRKNEVAHFMWDTWRVAGAERGSVVMNLWMNSRARRLRRFSKTDIQRELHRERGCVWMERLDNLQVIPIPHPTTPRELGAVIRWYKKPINDNLPSFTEADCFPGERETITEFITDDLWFRWRGSKLEQHDWGTTNKYGDVRTLFTWFRNAADIADSEDATAAQLLLLENTYTNAEISRSHAFPETLYVAFEPPMREDSSGKQVLEKGPNVAYVAQDPNAKILKVAAPAELGDVGLNDSRIHTMLDEALGLSQVERSQAGGGGGLGQLRSAPALGRLQGRSERRRRRKILAADKAERDLFRSVRDMTIYHCFPEEEREPFIDSRVVVTWPPEGFGVDTYTEAQKDQIETTAGLETRREQLRKRHPEASEAELDEMETKIEKDLEAANKQPERQPDPNATLRSNTQPESS
jgi:hypothetical protein